MRLTFVLWTLGFSSLVNGDVTESNRVLIEGSDIGGVGVGERVDVLKRPESGVPSPRTLAVLVRATTAPSDFRWTFFKGGGGLQRIVRVTKPDVFGAVRLADVAR